MGTHHLGYKNCNNLTINIQSMLIFLINYNQLYVQVHIEFHIIICIVKYYMHPPIPKRKVQISRENINIMVNNIYTNNVFYFSTNLYTSTSICIQLEIDNLNVVQRYLWEKAPQNLIFTMYFLIEKKKSYSNTIFRNILSL